tara:strand:+ start:104 stop:640 length:537 start_codon:yes stop_codon:yes gene_type:complete
MKNLNLNLFKFIIFIFFIFYNPAFSEIKFISSEIEKVIITDGDSIKIGKQKIRLFGIDAPELKQICYNKSKVPYACGHQAKEILKKIITNKKFLNHNKKYIYCYYSERDKYNRILGECFIGKDSKYNVNEYMVGLGHAVAYLRYSKKYLDWQESAKLNNNGLWSGTFETPEEWRKKNK